MPFIGIILSFFGSMSPKTLMIIGAVILVSILLAGLHHKIWHAGYDTCRTEQDQANLLQKEKFHEIARLRPDTDAIVKRLLAGKY